MIQNHSPLVRQALDTIHQRYPYLYGSTDIAEALGVSSPHLIRQFKKELAQTPTAYLIHHKLEQAKILLLQENLYIDTVANLVGFSTGNYFAKVFKKEYQMTPSQYIQSMANTPTPALDLSQNFPELYL